MNARTESNGLRIRVVQKASGCVFVCSCCGAEVRVARESVNGRNSGGDEPCCVHCCHAERGSVCEGKQTKVRQVVIWWEGVGRKVWK